MMDDSIGIDISKTTLDVCRLSDGVFAQFPNTALSENAADHKNDIDFTKDIRALDIVKAAKPAFSDKPNVALRICVSG